MPCDGLPVGFTLRTRVMAIDPGLAVAAMSAAATAVVGP
jgi:hypothetical protein